MSGALCEEVCGVKIGGGFVVFVVVGGIWGKGGVSVVMMV